MNRMHRGLLCSALALSAWILCTDGGIDIAGTSSGGETSTVAGYVRGADGTPQKLATVLLRPINFLAPIPLGQPKLMTTLTQTTTDTAGYFRLGSVERGRYSIEVVGEGNGSLTNFDLASDTTLADQIILPYGSITGAHSGQPGATHVQIYGLDKFAVIDSATGTYWLDGIPAGTYSLRFVGADSTTNPPATVHGISLQSDDTASVTNALPAPWLSASVGNQTPRGSAVMVDGRFAIAGGGPDIWNAADGFHFVYQPWIGDGEIVAHVASFDYGREYFSKAGVQFRASLDPSAPNIGLSLEIDDLDRHVAVIHYRTIAGDTSYVRGDTNTTEAPAWVRLVRTGDIFTGMASPDGIAWDTIGVDTVAMVPEILVGMAVTSHDTTRLSVAVVDSVGVLQR